MIFVRVHWVFDFDQNITREEFSVLRCAGQRFHQISTLPIFLTLTSRYGKAGTNFSSPQAREMGSMSELRVFFFTFDAIFRLIRMVGVAEHFHTSRLTKRKQHERYRICTKQNG